MKTAKTALIFSAAIVAFILSKDFRHKQEDFSPLEMANIEALSNSEVGDKCGGCDSSYSGDYCCTVVFYGVTFTLYHPKTLF